ncbi:MAG TPA: hypothetical protein VJR02_14540 [Pyrinomonadaceae bacterium]|nr:hypothetical protein [Pyrinomonadaceae bacterium]
MALNRSRILILILLCVIVTVAFVFASRKQNPETKAVKTLSAPQAWASPDPTPNDARDYKNVTARLENERVALSVRYLQAASSIEQANVIDQARTFVTRSIYTEIFPSWYGTAWDFNGTTEAPQQGKIACGYFVSTVLRDAGWRVQRARLAQQASENIILSLTTNAYVKRFRRVAIREFVDAVKNWGTGIYVVGLDIHTGFIVNTGDEVYFIHSSYVEPYAVVREKAIESKILTASKYRVLGKITANDRLLLKWLLKTEIVTH